MGTRSASILLLGLAACTARGDAGVDTDVGLSAPAWEVVRERDAAGMLMSVWGAPGEQAWVVGGSLTGGGVAWRLASDGSVTEVDLPDNTAMLTWVHGRAADDVWFAGLYGTLLHWDGQVFTSFTRDIPEAFWGVHAGPDGTVVAVGGPFRQVGDAPVIVRGTRADGLEPVGLPDVLADFTSNLFKVHHDGGATFCAIGAEGVALSLEASGEAAVMSTGTAQDLVTVHGRGAQLVAVGGRAVGGLYVLDGQTFGWTKAGETTAGASGVHLRDDGVAVVVGENGYTAHWGPATGEVAPGEPVTADLLHAVWVDPDDGTAWAAGGNWFGADYTGTLLRSAP